MIYNIKFIKSLESFILGLFVRLDICELIGDILGYRLGLYFD